MLELEIGTVKTDPLPNNKILDQTKLKALVEDKINK